MCAEPHTHLLTHSLILFMPSGTYILYWNQSHTMEVNIHHSSLTLRWIINCFQYIPNQWIGSTKLFLFSEKIYEEKFMWEIRKNTRWSIGRYYPEFEWPIRAREKQYPLFWYILKTDSFENGDTIFCYFGVGGRQKFPNRYPFTDWNTLTWIGEKLYLCDKTIFLYFWVNKTRVLRKHISVDRTFWVICQFCLTSASDSIITFSHWFHSDSFCNR